MIVVDLLILAILGYAVYAGRKRGFVLILLELASFLGATGIALLVYQPLGSLLKGLGGITLPLGHVAAFVLAWIIAEIGLAIVVRKYVLKHLTPELQHSPANQTGGAALGAVKMLVIITLLLVVFAGLPLSSGFKDPVTGAHIPKFLLGSSSTLQSWVATGIGRDIDESFNFFTITASPESEERVNLGFTTTGTVDPADETAMLALINHERTSRHLKPLTMNDKARAVARAHSTDMFAHGYFSHVTPDGKNPFDRMRSGAVQFGSAGENLALAPNLTLAHQGLMNSPGHRANILSPNYRTVGIGIIDGGARGLMVTQDFTD